MSNEFKPNYFFNLLISIDQFGNALTGGNPDNTISARVGYFVHYHPKLSHYEDSYSYGYWRNLEKIINYTFKPLEKNHCKRAYERKEDYQGNELALIALGVLVIVVCALISPIINLISFCRKILNKSALK